jgi:hypothetical protein
MLYSTASRSGEKKARRRPNGDGDVQSECDDGAGGLPSSDDHEAVVQVSESSIAAVLATLLVILLAGAGCTTISEAPSPADMPAGAFFRDASVIKLDPNGTVEWQTRLSFGRDTIPSSVVPMPGGGYALTGQAMPDGGNISPPRPFAAMLDRNGSLLWNRTLPPTLGPAAGSAAPAPDGSLIVTGSFGHFLRLDANGTVEWERVLLDWSAIRTIVPNPSGGYLVGGSAEGSAAVARLDESGLVLWSATLSGPGEASIERILPLVDGGCAVAGTADEDGQIRSSARVARLDSDGTLLWDRTVEEKGSRLVWEVSDLWEADGEIGTVYEVFRVGYDGNYETVVAVLGPDGSPVDRRTLDAFTPVLRTSDSGYTFAAFPMGDEGWFYYGTVLHVVRLDGAGTVIRDSAIDLGEGSQTGPFVETDDGGYVLAVTHGAANGVSSSTGSGAISVSVAFGRE